MNVVAIVIILAMCGPQSSRAQRTDRDYDELVGAVRMVRIESGRLPEDLPTGIKSERDFEAVVEYDRAGRLVKRLEGGFTSPCIRAMRSYSYDPGGERKETISWGDALLGSGMNVRNNALTYRQRFKVDPAGRWEEMDDYAASGELYQKIRYRYDDKGRVKEVLQGKDSSELHACIVNYNSLGLVAEQTCEHPLPDGSRETTTSKYAYETDDKGNWVKRTASDSASMRGRRVSRGGQITYRQIVYYPRDGEDRVSPQTENVALDATKLTPCPPLVIRKSGGVLEESASRKVVPTYPPEAIHKRVSGSVVVELRTDEGGKVVATRVVSGPAELREAAEMAARGWEFTPTILSKIPVRVIGAITFNFNL